MERGRETGKEGEWVRKWEIGREKGRKERSEYMEGSVRRCGKKEEKGNERVGNRESGKRRERMEREDMV